jgi:hypothetical protein
MGHEYVWNVCVIDYLHLFLSWCIHICQPRRQSWMSCPWCPAVLGCKSKHTIPSWLRWSSSQALGGCCFISALWRSILCLPLVPLYFYAGGHPCCYFHMLTDQCGNWEYLCCTHIQLFRVFLQLLYGEQNGGRICFFNTLTSSHASDQFKCGEYVTSPPLLSVLVTYPDPE